MTQLPNVVFLFAFCTFVARSLGGSKWPVHEWPVGLQRLVASAFGDRWAGGRLRSQAPDPPGSLTIGGMSCQLASVSARELIRCLKVPRIEISSRPPKNFGLTSLCKLGLGFESGVFLMWEVGKCFARLFLSSFCFTIRSALLNSQAHEGRRSSWCQDRRELP